MMIVCEAAHYCQQGVGCKYAKPQEGVVKENAEPCTAIDGMKAHCIDLKSYLDKLLRDRRLLQGYIEIVIKMQYKEKSVYISAKGSALKLEGPKWEWSVDDVWKSIVDSLTMRATRWEEWFHIVMDFNKSEVKSADK
jgi:hypothetical protein